MVIDLGGDTDTVACVTGGLVGAVMGIGHISSRWTTYLNGEVPGASPIASDIASLQALALRLDGRNPSPPSAPFGAGVTPQEVEPGLWLADLGGALQSSEELAVISLCRTQGAVRHRLRRQIWMSDDNKNAALDAALSDALDEIDAFQRDGLGVLVHCYGERPARA